MILYLECRSYGIALDIPTTRDEAASTIFSLIATARTGAPVFWIRRASPGSSPDWQRIFSARS